MWVLLARLLSAIRRGWLPAASISLDRCRQGGGAEGENVVWVSPMAHHSWQPMRGDGGLLTCPPWWALSGWHCCMQHPSMLNQMAKHDQVFCPLTSLHQHTPEITLPTCLSYPCRFGNRQQCIMEIDAICAIFISPWKCVTGEIPKIFIQSLSSYSSTTLTRTSLCECVLCGQICTDHFHIFLYTGFSLWSFE